MDNRKTLNEALRLLRLYCRLSQAELAEKLDVSQSLISEIEAGRKDISMDLLRRYSKSLGIRMSQLLFFAEEIDGEPISRRGQLIIAEKILNLLEMIKPPDHAPA